MCCPTLFSVRDLSFHFQLLEMSQIISLSNAHFILTCEVLHYPAFLTLPELIFYPDPLIVSAPGHCSLVSLEKDRHALERLGCSLVKMSFPQISTLFPVSEVTIKPSCLPSATSVLSQSCTFLFLFFSP